MKAVVTGATGFCGRHLVRYLESQGVEVHGFTSQSEADRESLHCVDAQNVDSLSAKLESLRPDYVFHLAGVSRNPGPSAFYRTNVSYAANLIEAMDRTSLEKSPILFVGSAAEYGLFDGSRLPLTEETECRPYDYYGASKFAQTLLGKVASQRRPVVLARPFNILGSGMSTHLSVGNFARQIAQITLGKIEPEMETGNLTPSRDFVDVTEVVRGYWELIQKPAAFGRVINICSGMPISMSEVLERLIRMSGKKIEVKTAPGLQKKVDVPVHYGDPTLFKSLLGWVPTVNLDQMLKNVLEGALKET